MSACKEVDIQCLVRERQALVGEAKRELGNLKQIVGNISTYADESSAYSAYNEQRERVLKSIGRAEGFIIPGRLNRDLTPSLGRELQLLEKKYFGKPPYSG